jgi:hypothetical protein
VSVEKLESGTEALLLGSLAEFDDSINDFVGHWEWGDLSPVNDLFGL